ncbi:uncharacterized protein LOC102432442 isoform X1 [Myotis lucifugus]|uniref:uncharacterized protein LOC102432442 isoform X1 n=1 Tax=Myotis lucifugus TaxID=59463 RepID=UPI000CCC6ECF|nr:uncharacterized protein LOC102432442 isoform X1 [Myotis lucifugus]
MDFEDDYTHSACRNTYQGFNGMDRDYGPGSYGGLAFKDIYLKILLLGASKAFCSSWGMTALSLICNSRQLQGELADQSKATTSDKVMLFAQLSVLKRYSCNTPDLYSA